MTLRACLAAVLTTAFLVAPLRAQDAQALLARHAAVSAELARNPFGRPLHVRSKDRDGRQSGEIYARLERSFDRVGPALERREHWCDILMLQVNVKYCEAPEAADTLSVLVSRKPREPLEQAHRLDFRYEIAAVAEDYLRVELRSPDGPLGTSDYRIRLEATPLGEERTFLHMSYSYALGLAARLVMQTYLATSGRHKVGFSVVDRLPDGRPVYVDGVRGVVERGAMRHYLAIEAFLGALGAHPAERLEKRLRAWYAATERYPEQLDEALERDEYLEMKRREALRRRVLSRSG